MQAHASSFDGVFPLPTAIDPSTPLAPAIDSSPPREHVDNPPVPAPTAHRAPAPAEAEAPPLPPSFTASLLADDGALAFLPAREAARFATGLGLAALYGVALGARHGGKAFFHHAASVPAALLAIAVLGVPALYIILALFDAPVEPPRMIAAAARAAARTGLVLAGLAPAAALFVVSSSQLETAVLAAAAGLFVAGVLGLRALLGELRLALASAPLGTRAGASAALLGFGLFATALAARVWWSTLVLLEGGKL